MHRPRVADFRPFAVFEGIPGIPLASNLEYTHYTMHKTLLRTYNEHLYASATFRSHPRRRQAHSEARAGLRAVPKIRTMVPKSHHHSPTPAFDHHQLAACSPPPSPSPSSPSTRVSPPSHHQHRRNRYLFIAALSSTATRRSHAR